MQTFAYTVLKDTNNLNDNTVEVSDYTIESLMAEMGVDLLVEEQVG